MLCSTCWELQGPALDGDSVLLHEDEIPLVAVFKSASSFSRVADEMKWIWGTLEDGDEVDAVGGGGLGRRRPVGNLPHALGRALGVRELHLKRCLMLSTIVGQSRLN